MNIKITLLTAACVLALSACAETPAPSVTSAADATTVAEQPATAPAPDAVAVAEVVDTDTATVAASPATQTAGDATATDSRTAVVADCGTLIEGNDAMQFNVSSIVVPSSCADFTITLKHTGKLPVTVMGHNVVVSKQADMKKLAAEGMGAGAAAGYIKSDDERVIAHTGMIGGGETTSLSFPVAKIQTDGPHEFFCSFPGHSAMMKGTISVE